MLHTIGWLASLINAHTLIASAHRLTAVGLVGSFIPAQRMAWLYGWATKHKPGSHRRKQLTNAVPSRARLSRSR